jgi:hypothetical protein
MESPIMTIRSTSFAPALSILALAGSPEAAHDAAFEALAHAVLQLIAHGNRRTLNDTIEALTEVKGVQAKRVHAVCVSAFNTAAASWDKLKKTEPGTVAERVDSIMVTALADYAQALKDAADTRAQAKAKRDAAKAAAEKEAARFAKEAKRAERAEPVEGSEGDSAVPAAPTFTLADALAMVRTACATGDEEALSALEGMVNDFFVTVDTPEGEQTRALGAPADVALLTQVANKLQSIDLSMH